MKNNKGHNCFFIISMWWFISTAIIGGLIFCFTSPRQRFSTQENRNLQCRPTFTFQSFIKGEYASLFESFISDNIPCRDVIINVSDKLLESISMNTSEDSFYLDTTEEDAANYGLDDMEEDDATNEETETNYGSVGDSDTNVSAQDVSPAVLALIRLNGEPQPIYTYPVDGMMKVAANLEKYAELIPEDGNVYFTTVPFPGVVRRFSHQLNVYSSWQSTLTPNMEKLTSDKVKCFNSIDILEPHLLEGEELFLYTNHQWTAHGAYYVASEMIASQGLTPTPFDEYEYKVLYNERDAYEYIYPLAPSNNYCIRNICKKEKIPFMCYYSASTSSYFYGNVQPWRTTYTGFNTGRNALVIGDCFSLAFTQYLLPYYNEVHAVDIRYNIFQKKELGTTVADMMQRNSIDDVYVIFSEANGVNSETLQIFLGKNLY